MAPIDFYGSKSRYRVDNIACCRLAGTLNREAVVQRLQRAISSAGRSLLDQFNLLKPLVEQMVIGEAIADVVVSVDQLENARLSLLHERGFDSMDHWEELLKALGCSEDEVIERLHHRIRRRSFIRERYEAKAEARFLERKKSWIRWFIACCDLKTNFGTRAIYKSNLVNPTSPI